MADDFLPTVEDSGVEIGEAAGVPRVDVVDVEMEDDFSPPIPAIIVSTSPTLSRENLNSYCSASRSRPLTNSSQ